MYHVNGIKSNGEVKIYGVIGTNKELLDTIKLTGGSYSGKVYSKASTGLENSKDNNSLAYNIVISNYLAITYDLNGGSYSGTLVESGYYGDNITLPTPTRSGYTFEGYSLSTGEYVTPDNLSYTVISNVKIVANWIKSWTYDVNTLNESSASNSDNTLFDSISYMGKDSVSMEIVAVDGTKELRVLDVMNKDTLAGSIEIIAPERAKLTIVAKSDQQANLIIITEDGNTVSRKQLSTNYDTYTFEVYLSKNVKYYLGSTDGCLKLEA